MIIGTAGTIWLLLQIGCSLCGGLCNDSPTNLGLHLGPLIFGNSRFGDCWKLWALEHIVRMVYAIYLDTVSRVSRRTQRLCRGCVAAVSYMRGRACREQDLRPSCAPEVLNASVRYDEKGFCVNCCGVSS